MILLQNQIKMAKRTKRFFISFVQCENEDTLKGYMKDLKESGAKVNSYSLCEDEEVGEVIIDVLTVEVEEFKRKFSETDSYAFADL